jgi:two-component system, NtrC family, sensor histidine kinase PilS
MTSYSDWMYQPHTILRWIYLGRISLASSIFVAAVFAWRHADAVDTLAATLAFVITLAFTGASAWWTVLLRREATRTFAYLQHVFDLLLVTAIVHLTGGASSQFAALYILVIASASLLLPARGGLLLAALGNVLYYADVLWSHTTDVDLAVILQLVVFAVAALGTGYLGARLREAGANREELEAQLEHTRMHAEDVLRNIRSGIITVNANGRLLYVNPAAGAMLGFNAERAIGQSASELLAPVSPGLWEALQRGVNEGQRTTRGEALLNRNGKSFPIGLTTTLTEADAALGGKVTTVIFQDISDDKRLEALRLRAERLEAVTELSASLAHEIKNPLASIRSAVEQLGRSSRATPDERTLAALIVRESDRLARLLTDFLDFARVRMTRVVMVNLGEVARSAAALASAHPDKGVGVRVRCDIAPGSLEVEGDEDLLHRAVFNTVLNAIQASPVRGEVRISVSRLPPQQLPRGVTMAGDAISIVVSDSGGGIPAEIRDRVFDPFFTTRRGGSGLGLPVVHRAIEAHRGLVFVDSTASGTRFTVLLPAALPASAGVAA